MASAKQGAGLRGRPGFPEPQGPDGKPRSPPRPLSMWAEGCLMAVSISSGWRRVGYDSAFQSEVASDSLLMFTHSFSVLKCLFCCSRTSPCLDRDNSR